MKIKIEPVVVHVGLLILAQHVSRFEMLIHTI
jgi:hypothetical protein